MAYHESQMLFGQEHQERPDDFKRKHHCTDLGCAVIFMVAMVFFYVGLVYGVVNGDVRRLYHGIDSEGRLCGLDNFVETLPVLYFCPNVGVPGGGVNTSHGVCLAECPVLVGPAAVVPALPAVVPAVPIAAVPTAAVPVAAVPTAAVPTAAVPVAAVPTAAVPTAAVPTAAVATAAVPAPVPAVTPARRLTAATPLTVVPQCIGPVENTTSLMGRYCIPVPPPPSPGHNGSLADEEVASELMGFMAVVTSCVESLPPAGFVIFLGFILSIVLGYAYLWFLGLCAKILLYIATIVSMLGMLCLAWYLYSSAELEEELDVEEGITSHSYELTIAFAWGAGAIGLGLGVLLCCCRHSLDVAAGCVEAACEVVMELPSLIFGCIVWALVKALFWIFFLYLFVCFFSTASITRADPPHMRELQLSDWQWIYVYYFLFFVTWFMGFLTAVYKFAIAFSVADYFHAPFKPEDPMDRQTNSCEFFQAMYVGLSKHTGSLAFGALVVGLFNWIAQIASWAFKGQHEANPLIRCILCAAGCCMTCCGPFIQVVNKNAFIDIAVTSSTFCQAGKNAMSILRKAPSIAILEGATFIFQIAGIALVTASTGSICYMVLTNTVFADDDFWFYVPGPFTATFFVLIISFSVSISFMDIFEMAADTLLYCYASEISKGASGYQAPAGMLEMVHGGPMMHGGGMHGGGMVHGGGMHYG